MSRPCFRHRGGGHCSRSRGTAFNKSSALYEPWSVRAAEERYLIRLDLRTSLCDSCEVCFAGGRCVELPVGLRPAEGHFLKHVHCLLAPRPACSLCVLLPVGFNPVDGRCLLPLRLACSLCGALSVGLRRSAGRCLRLLAPRPACSLPACSLRGALSVSLCRSAGRCGRCLLLIAHRLGVRTGRRAGRERDLRRTQWGAAQSEKPLVRQ
eukprot:scaffold23285_cov57-Phaeocystis_antarctica.AAC.1